MVLPRTEHACRDRHCCLPATTHAHTHTCNLLRFLYTTRLYTHLCLTWLFLHAFIHTHTHTHAFCHHTLYVTFAFTHHHTPLHTHTHTHTWFTLHGQFVCGYVQVRLRLFHLPAHTCAHGLPRHCILPFCILHHTRGHAHRYHALPCTHTTTTYLPYAATIPRLPASLPTFDSTVACPILP